MLLELDIVLLQETLRSRLPLFYESFLVVLGCRKRSAYSGLHLSPSTRIPGHLEFWVL